MRVLVTGAAGFIGSHYVQLVHRLRPGSVVALDVLTYAADATRVPPEVRLAVLDIRDQSGVTKLLREDRIEAVVNFAAESHVDRSITSPRDHVMTNVMGLQALLEAARAAGVRRFLQVSTDEVYGHLGPDGPPFSEESPLRPRNPYAATKAAGDCLALAYHATYGLDVVVTRGGNNFGPHQHDEKLIPRMVRRAMAGETLTVHGSGHQIRDWIHAEDHVAGIDAALHLGRAGQVYNVGAENERTILEVVETIAAHLGLRRDRIVHVEDRRGNDRRYALCAHKARREFGWRPRKSWDVELARTVAWYSDRFRRGAAA